VDVTVHTPSSPLQAGFRSLLLPGWGQLANRHRVLGWFSILVTLATVGIGAAVFIHLGPLEIAARLADPDTLLTLVGVNVLIAGARLFATGHAWWAGGGRNWFTAAVLAVLVLVPHVVVGWMGMDTRDMLLDVFADSGATSTAMTPPPGTPPASVEPAPAPASTTMPTTTTTTTTTTIPGTPVTLPLTPSLTPPTAPPPTLPFSGDRFNLLILGGDAGPDRPGLRTDTAMIASFAPTTGDAALVGLPRNYTHLSLTDGTELGDLIFNEVYEWGLDHQESFEGLHAGAAAVADVAEYLTGLEIDHFMLVDMTGFASVVDAFGGVTLTVPRAIYGPLYDVEDGSYEMITIPTGKQTLTGAEALAYTRARQNSSDYSRMGRQRCVLAAMVAGAEPLTLLTSLPELLDTVETHVTTDLPLDLVPGLIRLLPEVTAGDIRVIGFDHTWRLGRSDAGHAIPDVERIRAAVAELINSDEPGPGDAVERACT